MRIAGLACCMAVLTAAGCSFERLPEAPSRLGPSPALSGGSYTSGGGITVATEVREANGLTAVCGAWAQSHQQSILTKHVEMELLQTGTVYLGKERLLTGLNFMKEVPPAESYANSEAVCVRTQRPWRDGDEARPVMTRIPRQIVHIENGDELGGGAFVVYYRADGPAAGDP